MEGDPPFPNAVIGTKRAPTMDPVTKQTAAPVAYLSGINATIKDTLQAASTNDTRAGQLASQYRYMALVQKDYDIVGGDQITGFNPSGQSPAPIFVVGHVSPPGSVLPLKKLWLNVLGGISP